MRRAEEQKLELATNSSPPLCAKLLTTAILACKNIPGVGSASTMRLVNVLVLSCILHASALDATKIEPQSTPEHVRTAPAGAPKLLLELDTDLDGCVDLEEINAAFSRLNITRLLKWVRHGAELPEFHEPILGKKEGLSLASAKLATIGGFDTGNQLRPVERISDVPKQRGPKLNKLADPTRAPYLPLALSRSPPESPVPTKNHYLDRTAPVERNAIGLERGHTLRKTAEPTPPSTPSTRLPHLHRGLQGLSFLK